MAVYGHLKEFYPGEEDWKEYIERLEFYFVANEITDEDKKRAIMLSVVGGTTYKLMRNLLSPVKPGEKSFTELKALIQEHHNPKPSEIVQRFKFNSRTRKNGETVSNYVAELRKLSENCEFEGSLEVMIRDRLVCGINDDRIQRRLLSESKLDFKKALDIATSMELAAKSAATLQQSDTGTVHKVGKQRHNFTNKTQKKAEGKPCYRCNGTSHKPEDCRYKDSVCFNCSKKGHVQKACRADKKQTTKQVANNRKQGKPGPGKQNFVESDEDEIYTMFSIGGHRPDPYKVEMELNGNLVQFEVDTGASATVLNCKTWEQLKDTAKLGNTSTRLKTYSGEYLKILGKCELSVKYDNKTVVLPIIVVDNNGPNLLGRNWLEKIRLNWGEICMLQVSATKDNELNVILRKYGSVFNEGLGKISGVKAKIYTDGDAKPRYFKARPVPYAMKEGIDKELERLQKEGTITPVEFSEWAAPIVPIVKSDKSIRICGDYKVTINQCSKLDNYPIPKISDLYATLNGGKQFTKLDLSQAYLQLELDEQSKQYVTINTHRGLFVYNRMPYGVISCPGIFQRTMENMLQGLSNVIVRVDDILITGRSRKEHLHNVDCVLERLAKHGVRLNRNKCEFMSDLIYSFFMANEVVYLGHKLTEKGVTPLLERVQAIQEMPAPINKKQLQSYLGMINFYHMFLKDVSTVLKPLHSLLMKGVNWKWGEKENQAFLASKKLLASSDLLVHFDPDKQLLLTCDASPYGVAAVLSHQMEDGSERPVAYASRTLSGAEKNYSVLEKEALALVFGVKKFHQYLYGKEFTLLSDHKPLLGLLKEDKQIPTTAAARIQRWALTLAGYDYVLRYKKGPSIGNADGLSRLPRRVEMSEPPVPTEIISAIEQLAETPVTSQQVRLWTQRDPVMSKVTVYVQKGWPEKCPNKELRPYFAVKNDLSVFDGCLLRGNRVIIPVQGRETMLNTLHEGHPGCNRMKSLARMYVWWPLMDTEIESHVKSCCECQLNRNMPAEAKLHPWEWPDRPWVRLHVDYAGPFMGKMFLIIIDAHSKWIEAFATTKSTSAVTIELLQRTFATYGLCQQLVTDNGSSFTSAEFEEFMKQNGIKHIRTASYHAASNGLAERAVGIVKNGLKKQRHGTIRQKLSKVLLTYRITPHSTLGVSPSELLFGRKLRSRLDLVLPNFKDKVEKKQANMKTYHDKHAKTRELEIGDHVFVWDSVKHSWTQGTISNQTGPVSYEIEVYDGRKLKKHVDHIRDQHCGITSNEPILEDVSLPNQLGSPVLLQEESVNLPTMIQEPEISTQDVETPIPQSPGQKSPEQQSVQRPQRDRKPPIRFKDYV